MKKKSVKKAVDWYAKRRDRYVRLADKVEKLIKDILDSNKIPYHSVVSRAKDIDSFEIKASKAKYEDPTQEIMDLAGIRVVSYVDIDVRRICSVIEETFKILPEHYIDKSKTLGVDKVGYRSVHYIAEFIDERYNLPEFQTFKGLYFEIQVRSILQHAWAEIEHDRNYKFHGVLPEHIQRRFAVLAGVLELADREFDSIASEIDSYAENVGEETKKGKLDIEINTTSLREYLITRFNNEIELGFKPAFGRNDVGGEEIINELEDMGIKKLSELERIIPNDFLEKASTEICNSNFTGILRTLFMVFDIEKYFSNAWKRKWSALDEEGYMTLRRYNLPIDKYMRKYDISLESLNNYSDDEYGEK